MTAVLVFAGFCAVIAGLGQIFMKDLVWRSARSSNRRRDNKTGRRSTWKASFILYGILGIAIGILLLLFADQVGQQSSTGSTEIQQRPGPLRSFHKM